jgi:hypothetical protein
MQMYKSYRQHFGKGILQMMSSSHSIEYYIFDEKGMDARFGIERTG